MQCLFFRFFKQHAPDFYQFNVHNDQLFWSRWMVLSLNCDLLASEIKPLVNKSHGPADLISKSEGLYDVRSIFIWLHEHGIIAHESQMGHMSMRYGYTLTLLNLMIAFWQTHNTDTRVLKEIYATLFDAALETPSFDFDQSLMRVSLDFVHQLLSVLDPVIRSSFIERQHLCAAQLATDALVHDVARYIQRHHQFSAHSKVKLIRSVSFRLEYESLKARNKSLVSQYIRHVDMPGFVQDMLLGYWSNKMSLVSEKGNGNFCDWQFYWSFVSRIIRYFRSSEAMLSQKSLNEDFDLLVAMLKQEAAGISMSYAQVKFMYSLREYHLEKMNLVKQMQRARKVSCTDVHLSINTQKPSRNDTVDCCQLKKMLVVGARFWFFEHQTCLAGELIVTNDDALFVFAFDQGKYVMMFSLEELEQLWLRRELQSRYTYRDYISAQRPGDQILITPGELG